MFRTVPLFIIRSFSLYTQQWYMSYRFADSLRASVVAEFLSRLCSKHTHHGYICCHNTDYVHDRTITVILAKHCISSLMMDPL